MKKSISNIFKIFCVLIIVSFMGTGIFLFSGCSKNKKELGYFNTEKIVISKNEKNIEFQKYLKRLDESISFESGDEEIIGIDNYCFSSINSGETLIYSIYNGKKIDHIKVFVKDKLDTPNVNSFAIDSDGNLSWNAVTSKDGQNVASYTVRYRKNVWQENEWCETRVNTNSFSLEEKPEEGYAMGKGEYKVQVKANGFPEVIDDSDFTEAIVSYSFVGDNIKNIKFTPQDGISKCDISWESDNYGYDKVKYYIHINGEKVAVATSQKKYSLDLSQGDTFKIQIEEEDTENKKLSLKSQVYTISKLKKPEVKYENGYLSWTPVDGVTEYKVGYGDNYFTTTNTKTSFEEIDAEDIGKEFDVSVQAIGDVLQNNVFYMNSDKVSLDKKVVKLVSPEVEYEKKEGKLAISIKTQDSYIKNFDIFQKLNDKEKSYEATIESQGDYFCCSKEIELKDSGKYEFYVQAVPTKESESVKPYNNAEYVLKSKITESKYVYKLKEITELKHEIGDSGCSLISFNSIDYANKYSVFVNGYSVDLSDESVKTINGKTYINIGNIKSNYGLTNGKEFKISLTVKAETREEDIVFETNKEIELKVLNSPNITDTLELTPVDKDINAQYVYKIYKKEKENASIEESVLYKEGYTEKLNIPQPIEEGFYTLIVNSVPKDFGGYYESITGTTKDFVVTKKIASPEIEGFTCNDEKIEIKIACQSLEKTRDDYRKCEVYIGSDLSNIELIGSIETENRQQVVFEISKDSPYYEVIKNNDIYIYVKFVANNETLKNIYDDSDYSSLHIVKTELSSKNLEFTNNKIYLVGIPEKTIPNIKCGDYEGQSFNTSTIGTDGVELEYGYLGYDSIKADKEFCFDSPIHKITVKRDDKPVKLEYTKDKKITFEYSGKAVLFKVKVNNIEYELKDSNFSKSGNVYTINSGDLNILSSDKVEVSLCSIIGEEKENAFYINSSYSDILEITYADKPTISFNKELKLTINGNAEEYVIYLNGEVYAETTNSVIAFDDKFNEGETNTIYVVAKENNKFEIQSDSIAITRIESIDKITLGFDTTSYYSWDCSKTTGISGIKINDALYSKNGKQNLNGDIKLNIQAISIDSKGQNYYLDSYVKEFNLKELSSESYSLGFGVNESENKIQWNMYGEDGDGVKYIVKGFGKNITTDKNEISIDTLKTVAPGEYNISIIAYLEGQDVTNNKENLYLYKDIGSACITKLATISNLKLEYDIENVSLDSELSKTIKFTWDSVENASSYKIALNNENDNITETSHEITTSDLKAGEYTFKVYAENTGISNLIHAQSSEFKFSKAEISDSSISDEGVLTCSNTKGLDKYIVKATYNNQSCEKIIESGNNIFDVFSEIIGESSSTSDFTVEIVAKSNNISIISSDKHTYSKQILKQGSVDSIIGTKIIFSNSEADSLKIGSSIIGKTQLNSQTVDDITYYTEVQNSGAGFLYHIMDTEDTKDLVYSFKKQGNITSKEQILRKCTDITKEISKVSFKYDNENNLIGTPNASDKKYYMDIYNGNICVASVVNDNTIIPFYKIANKLGLQSNTYKIELYTLNSDNKISSNCFELKMNVNIDLNLQINKDNGLLEITDNGSNTYILKCGEKAITYSEKLIDYRQICNDVSSSIKLQVKYNSLINTNLTSGSTIDINSKIQTFKLSDLGVSALTEVVSIDKNNNDLLINIQSNLEKTYSLYIIKGDNYYSKEINKNASETTISIPQIDIWDMIGSDVSDVKVYLIDKAVNYGKTENFNVTLDIENIENVDNKNIQQSKLNYIDYVNASINYTAIRTAWIKILKNTEEINKQQCSDFSESGSLNVSDIFENSVYNENVSYSLYIAPIINNTQYSWFKLETDYIKLPQVDSIKISQDGEELVWDTKNRDITNYELNINDNISYINKDNNKKSYEDFDPNIKYKIKITSLSTEIGYIYSSEKEYLFEKANEITADDFNLENGSLSLKWGGHSETEYEKLEDAVASRNFIDVMEYLSKKSEINTANADELIKQIKDIQYIEPYAFNLNNITNEIIVLEFNNNKLEVELVKILEKFEYLAVLEALKNNASEDSCKIWIRQVYDCFNYNAYWTGIANSNLLFDSINDQADALDPGKYDIKAYQRGNQDNNVLRSNSILCLENYELLYAPKLTAIKEDITNNNKIISSKYQIEMGLIDNYSLYKMVFMAKGQSIEFIIRKENNKWVINNSETINLVEKDVNSDKYLVIPINTVGDQTGIDSIFNFTTNVEYKVGVYVGGDNSSKINGKNDLISVTFLKQAIPVIDNGQIKIAPGSKIIYKDSSYKYQVLGSYSELKPGKYGQLIFISQGSKDDKYTIRIDSKACVLEEVTKLEEPGLSMENGKIKITDKNTGNNYTSNIQIKGEGKSYSTVTGTYFIPGEAFENINKYYAIASGDSSVIEINGKTADPTILGYIDLLKRVDGKGYIFLMSDESPLNAKMLKNKEGLKVTENGDIEWNEFALTGYDSKEWYDLDKYTIVYKVEINGYRKTSTVDTLEETWTFYTVSNSLSADLITDYCDKYKVELSAMLCKKKDNVTLENRKDNPYEFDDNYKIGEYYILNSAVVKNDFERAPIVEDCKITGGELSWEDLGNDYYYKVYYATSSNSEPKEDKEGKVSVKDNRAYYTFGVELASNTSHYLYVKTFNKKGQIASIKQCYINKCSILPKFTEDHFEVKSENGNIIFDFSKYSASNYTLDVIINKESRTVSSSDNKRVELKPDSDTNTYKIAITPKANKNNILNARTYSTEITYVVWGENDEILWNEEDRSFNWTYSGKSFSGSGYNDNLLYTLKIVTKNEKGENENNKTTFESTRTYYDLKTTKFYPEVQGEIISVSVSVREGKNGLQSNALTFEPEKPEKAVKFILYNDGDGSAENPYKITNEEEFKNINFRLKKPDGQSRCEEIIKETTISGGISKTTTQTKNINDIKIYFKLENDLEFDVEGFKVNGVFEGILDGQNYKLTLKISACENNNYSINEICGNVGSLFDTIGKNGVVKNINIEAEFNVENNNSIMSLIATKNDGLVSNIIIKEIIIEGLADSEKDISNIVLGQIVGINNGTIEDSSNESEITCNLNNDSDNILYSAIVALNNTEGKILNCGNKNNISIINANVNSKIIVSGVCLFNNGEMSFCYNDGNITVDESNNKYASGLIYQNNNYIGYSYNNGSITGQYVAGIEYEISKDATSEYIFAFGKINENYNGELLYYKKDNLCNINNIYTYAGVEDDDMTAITTTEFTVGDYKLSYNQDGPSILKEKLKE